MVVKVLCFHCLKILELSHTIGRKEECQNCRSDLHVCKNCQFYSLTAYNECLEPQSELVREKERSNFCDYFVPRLDSAHLQSQKDHLLSAAEALFKKKD